MQESINERINPFGRKPYNPVLRWISGHASDTIMLESDLVPSSDGYTEQLDYCDPIFIWGREVNDDMLDTPISDDEWKSLLDCVGIR